MNSLERSGAKDTLERFSMAIEQLGPIVAVLLLVPSALLLAGAGAYSGWALATGELRTLPFEALRYLLLAAWALAIVGPFILPAGERTNAVRLLLLPIPRGTLYVAQAASALSDPWILLVIPAVLAIPLGLLAGGAFAAALVAALAGLLLLAVLVGVGSVVTSLIHIVVRNRRRGELFTLIFILVIPLVAVLPSLIEGSRSERPRSQRVRVRTRQTPEWLRAIEQKGLRFVPSEMYVATTRSAAAGEAAPAAVPLVALSATAAALHGVGLLLFGRVLASPGTISPRRTAARRGARARRIPGLTPGASAVALAQIRLAARTPRGRSILLSPLIVFVMFAVMIRRSGTGLDVGFLSLDSGIALATFGGFVSLMAILPIAMNQFAIDGAGLTLTLLSPLDDGELLRGKAVGLAAIALAPALLCLVGATIAFPGGDPALWLSVPLGLIATYVLVAPAAVALSALFPRAVDLNSIGRGSNAHGAAGFLGMLAFVAAGAPALLIVLAATRLLERPALAPALLAAWCAIAAGLARLLFVPARAVFARRRENLGLVAGG
jgi:hypothetical protein